MLKNVYGRKLSRNSNSRKALLRSLTRGLVLSGSITTTRAKAKALVPEVDKLMGYVRADTLASRRLAFARLGNDKEVLGKLFSEYMSLAKSRTSGYTRIVQLPNRTGDNAPMATLEWVEKPIDTKQGVKEKPVKKATKKETKKK